MDLQQIKNVYERMCRKLTKSDICKLRFILTDILDEKIDNPIHEAYSALNLFIAAFGQEHLTLQLLMKIMFLLGRNDLAEELAKKLSPSPSSHPSGELKELVRGRRLHLLEMLERKQLNKGCMTDIVFFHNLNADLAQKEWPAVVERLLYKYPLDLAATEASVSDWVREHFDKVLGMSQLRQASLRRPTSALETDEVTATSPEYASACTTNETEVSSGVAKNSKAEHQNKSRRLGTSDDDVTDCSCTTSENYSEGHNNTTGRTDTRNP